MSKMIASILYCHERNVCHRDVKLDNFVYESNGEDAELKLIDFGLSHVLLHTQEKMHDRVGIPRPVESTGHATCATLACATRPAPATRPVPPDLCLCPVGPPRAPTGAGRANRRTPCVPRPAARSAGRE